MYCKHCLEKDLKIEELKETIKSLQAKLRYRQRKEQEGYFGASTPSSKLPYKANSDNHAKGGALAGHAGHGRASHTDETADEVIEHPTITNCPTCGGHLALKEMRDRTVIEASPTMPRKLLYHLPVMQCRSCRKIFRTKAPSVLPKSLFGNQLSADLAVMHYLHGIPMGRLAEMTGINPGSIVELFHRLARYPSAAMGALKEEYRHAPVKHADETGWRNDGDTGYAWLFCTDDISIFSFKDTRSSQVPKAMFGSEKLPGVLVVDRYAGYNKAPLPLQYCYAHLLRDVEKLAKDSPDDEEVCSFAGALIPLLTEAMHLRTRKIADEEYYEKAGELRERIRHVARSPAHHLGVRAVQDIFIENDGRLFHWAENRRVPADNNRAERDLRPTVIARKVSFGSGSDEGAHTRSILMSVLHTMNKRRGTRTTEQLFKGLLDEIAMNPEADLVPFVLRPGVMSGN